MIKVAFAARIFCIAAVGVCSSRMDAAEPWIIDTHTHFKGAEQVALESQSVHRDPRDTLGHVVTTEAYRPLARRLGIQATIIVEAVQQEHPQFNDWVLKQAQSNLVCGYIARGNLASAGFANNYERYRKSGYLRGYRFRMDELRGYLKNEQGRKNLRRLEQDGMVVDLLVESQHAGDVADLARSFPKLTIVIDHCFRARVKDGNLSPEWQKAVSDCGKFPNVACKLSSILNFTNAEPFADPAPNDLKSYLAILQTCYDALGEDRVMFGTNWGVCTHFGKVDDVVRIVSEFLESHGEAALKKGMRENAIRIYKVRAEHLR